MCFLFYIAAIAGMNTSSPNIIDTNVTNSVAAAATSLTFLALTEYSNDTMSTMYSIAVLKISNPITSPMAIVRIDHCATVTLNTKPNTITSAVTNK